MFQMKMIIDLRGLDEDNGFWDSLDNRDGFLDALVDFLIELFKPNRGQRCLREVESGWIFDVAAADYFSGFMAACYGIK